MLSSKMGQQLLAPVISLVLITFMTIGCRSPTAAPLTAVVTATPTLLSSASATPAPPTFTPPSLPCNTHTAAVELAASATTLQVGQVVTISVTLQNQGCSQLGLLQYRLETTPPLLNPAHPEAMIHYLGLEPGQADTVEFGLRASETGQVTLTASAGFEVHLGNPGPAYWATSSAAAPLAITVIGQTLLPGVQLPPTTVPTPKPVGVVVSTDPLLDFPLNLGNTWVYSATYYDTYGVEPITATYRITETVVDTRVYSSALAAQILRTSTVVTLSDNLAGKDWQQHYLAGRGATAAYWYVISGTRVYQQDGLDWAKITADEATLEYIFPLSVNTLWYPDPQQRTEFLHFEVLPGTRAIRDQVDRQVPAGLFRDCFEITTFYNGGSPVSWFCPDMGVVENRFDHVGTPFGHTAVLLDYRLNSEKQVITDTLNFAPWLGPLTPIQPDNAANLTEVAQLGKGTIYDFAWLPDTLPGAGGRLLVGAPRGLYVYRADTLSETQFIPTGSPATAAAVSPDGSLVTAAQENFIQLWSLADGALHQNLSEHRDAVSGLAFSPDRHSRWLASGSKDGTLRLWDIAAGQARHIWSFTPGGRFVFSPDGRWLAVGGGKWNRQVEVYDLATGQLAAELDISPDLTGLTFSPDGSTLALLPSGEYPTPVLLWDFQTGQTRRLAADQPISSASFSPDGAVLTTGSLDGEVRVWDLANDQSQLLGQHPEIPRYLAFSPNGQWLVSADTTRLKLWDVKAKTLRYDLEQFAAGKLRFSPDSRTLAFQRGGTVGLVDLASGQLDLLLGHSDLIASLAFAPNTLTGTSGQTLAVGDWSGLVQLWDTSTEQPLRVFDGHTGPVGNLAFSPIMPVLASGGINEDHTVHLWDAHTGQHIDAFNGDPDYPMSGLVFSPDGRTLAGGGLNGVVLHDIIAGDSRRLTGHTQPVLSVAISPDGRRLASGSFDETVIIWDFAAGQPLHTLPGHTLGVAELAFNPDGQWLLTGDQQDKIRGWGVEGGQLLQTIAGRGQDLAISPDGRLLAYKPTIETIALWDIVGGREVIRHVGEHPLAFSPDGRLLVVGEPDGLVTLWGVK